MMNRMTRFILMITLEIPAIILSIVILIYFVTNHQARFELKNHGWFILIIVNFIQLLLNLPMPMSYYYIDDIWPATNVYCFWWTWCEYSLNSVGLFLMAWISIERHIVIFHSHTILQGHCKKWIFHFLPIIFCVMWAPIFFFVLVIISPLCTTQWDFNTVLCGFPCYYGDKFFSQFDFIFDLATPVMMILFANVTLILRVIYQKISREQIINWRRHRKMVLQLWIISSLYMACWLPIIITILIQLTLVPSFMVDQLETMQFLVYLIPLLLPMICLSTLPELTKKIINRIKIRPLNMIGVINYNRNPRQTVTVATGR